VVYITKVASVRAFSAGGCVCPAWRVGACPRGSWAGRAPRAMARCLLAGSSLGSHDGCHPSMAAEILAGIHTFQQVNI